MEMDAGIVVAGGMFRQRARVAADRGQFLGEAVHPLFDGGSVGFQPRIIGHELRFA